jgi:hypothetical protein
MPSVELTDLQLAMAGRGARSGARQARQDAERQTNPNTRSCFDMDAQAFDQLAEKFESARTASPESAQTHQKSRSPG